MASKLSTPADFENLSSRDSGIHVPQFQKALESDAQEVADQAVLLPPSCFETPAAGSGLQVNEKVNANRQPWTDVVKSVEEIVQLLDDYKQLRLNSGGTGMHVEDRSKPRMTVALDRGAISMPPGADQSYVFQQLAVAVSILHSQLEQMHKLLAEKEQVEASLSKISDEKEAAVASYNKLIAEKELSDTTYSNSLVDLRQQYATELSALKSRHQTELETLKQHCDEQISEHVKNLADAHRLADVSLAESRRGADEEKTDLLTKISEYAQQIEQQQQEIHSMKVYLSQSESLMPESEALKQELSDLRATNHTLELKNRSLTTENSLLSTRLSAMNDVLTTQEQYVSQDMYNVNSKKKLLLTRWREKVYELLVQMKSTTISCDQQCHKWACKIDETDRRLVDADSKYNTLLHSFRDKQAVCDLKQAQIDRLTAELREGCKQLDDEKVHHNETILSLRTVYDAVQRTFELYSSNTETSVKQLYVKLRSHSNRIGFATGRLNLVQAEIARFKAASSSMQSDLSSINSPALEFDIHSELEELKGELSRVVGERDKLANDLKNDAIKLNDRIAAATKQAISEAEELRVRMRDLHAQLDDKTQSVTEQLDAAKAELSDAGNEIERLKMEIGKAQAQLQAGINEAKLVMEQQHSEQIYAIEKDLQEAKRQHTKAVVSLRQLERQLERNGEKFAADSSRLQQECEQQVQQLRTKLENLQAENNLLMATLKQEGLLGRYNASAERPSVRHDGMGHSFHIPTRLGASPTGAPVLSDVINDLKQLTSELSENDDDD